MSENPVPTLYPKAGNVLGFANESLVFGEKVLTVHSFFNWGHHHCCLASQGKMSTLIFRELEAVLQRHSRRGFFVGQPAP